MAWNHHSITIQVQAPIERVFYLYHNLPDHSRWSPWISKVDWTDYNRQQSRWVLRKFGINLTWSAVNHTVIPPRLISWKSIDGTVRQAGRVEFRSARRDLTLIDLTVSFMLPRFLSMMFAASWVEQQVQQMLKGDLGRFAEFVEARMRSDNNQLSEDPLFWKVDFQSRDEARETRPAAALCEASNSDDFAETGDDRAPGVGRCGPRDSHTVAGGAKWDEAYDNSDHKHDEGCLLACPCGAQYPVARWTASTIASGLHSPTPSAPDSPETTQTVLETNLVFSEGDIMPSCLSSCASSVPPSPSSSISSVTASGDLPYAPESLQVTLADLHNCVSESDVQGEDIGEWFYLTVARRGCPTCRCRCGYGESHAQNEAGGSKEVPKKKKKDRRKSSEDSWKESTNDRSSSGSKSQSREVCTSCGGTVPCTLWGRGVPVIAFNLEGVRKWKGKAVSEGTTCNSGYVSVAAGSCAGQRLNDGNCSVQEATVMESQQEGSSKAFLHCAAAEGSEPNQYGPSFRSRFRCSRALGSFAASTCTAASLGSLSAASDDAVFSDDSLAEDEPGCPQLPSTTAQSLGDPDTLCCAQSSTSLREESSVQSRSNRPFTFWKERRC